MLTTLFCSTNSLNKMDTARGKLDQACRVAEEFTKFYYEAADKRRHMIARLYLDEAVLAWNGTGLSGNEKIQKFHMDLPASDHTLNTLDAQPILEEAVCNRITFLIQVSGTVRYQDKVPKTFQQSFVITADGGKWKIVSDCFRLQEPLSDNK